MFFYTALFVACVFAAIVVLYLYNALADISKVVYRALLPSSKTKFDPEQKEQNHATTVNHTPTPWGWGSNTASNRTSPKPAVLHARRTPWGWPGNDKGQREQATAKREKRSEGSDLRISYSGSGPSPDTDDKPKVGWPYREEQFEFAGKAYKVTRKVTPKQANLTSNGKPWGW